MKKVSIIGATISGNRGAESMLSTEIGRIREHEPDVAFNVFSYYPGEDRKLCTMPNIAIYSAAPAYLVLVIFPFACLLGLFKIMGLRFFKPFFPKAVRALNDSDVLIDISGVSFMDGRVKFIPFNVLTIFPAMAVGTPVVKFSQALGPFGNPLVRIPARIFLSGCARIFARGKATEKNLRGLKICGNIIDSAADIAFLHKPDYALSVENPAYIKALADKLEKMKKRGQTVIGLCPSSVVAARAHREGWNYPVLLCEIIRLLSENGFAVLLFPNATRQKSRKLRNNDLPVIEKAARYLAAFNEYPDNLLIVTKDINTAGIKTLLEYCDLGIVSRFHAMISCLVMEKPVVVMGWGHKYQEVMDQFGLGKFVFDYKNKNPKLLLDKVVSALAQKRDISENIKNRLPEVQRRAYRQFEFLFDMLARKRNEK
ncbi:MAG: polysaccharide pyruvyl transferase family protein [Deltaproteobacteria bacterium]|nr:polysaccharide pyruvyl transferase family protein [Deltaproteobacteria bacterium]